MRNKLREVANEVREQVEDFAFKNDFDANLEGLCSIASTMLFEQLKKNGLKPVLHVAIDKPLTPQTYHFYHVFVSVSGYVIDITASQFDTASENYPNVLIKKEGTFSRGSWQWKTFVKFRNSKELVEWQKKECHKANLISSY